MQVSPEVGVPGRLWVGVCVGGLLEARIERLSSRGIIYEQGKDLEKVEIEGTTFVILPVDNVIGPGRELTLTNVIFEGRKPAIVLVVGDGDGDLDLWVYDGDSDRLIGEDTDETSVCVVEWMPRYEGPFTIRVANVGDVAEEFYVLANW